MSTKTLIVGGGHIGRLLARRMDDRRDAVHFVDDSETAVRRARENGVPAREATLTSPRSLNAAGVDGVETAIAAALEDSTNLLVVQLLRCRFDVPRIVALVNDPQNRDVFEELGVESVCATTAITSAVIRSAAGSDDAEPGDSSTDDRLDGSDDRSEEGSDRTVVPPFDHGNRRGAETFGTGPFAGSSGNRFGLTNGGSD